MSDTVPGDGAVQSVVERFTSLLVTSGVGRMPARVYSAVLCSEDGRLTAGELAEVLQISPAAVSGAVRYLIGVGMLERHRPIGARRDEYALVADNWYEVFMNREPLLDAFTEVARSSAATLGTQTRAGARMAESAEFFAFLRVELDAVLQRWQQRRAQARTDRKPRLSETAG